MVRLRVPSFRLVTLDRVTLLGPLGPVNVADPRHLAVLVRLAAAPGRSLVSNDLLLSIWPHLTPQQGTNELAKAASVIAAMAGTPLVVATADRWILDAAVGCDVDGALPASAPSFAAGLALPDTPEWDEWVATVRQVLANRPVRIWNRPWAKPVLIGLAVTLVAAAGYRWFVGRPIEGFTPGDRAILADVENTTADSSLGRSLGVAAAVALQQSRRLELVPRGQVQGGPTPMTAEVALDAGAKGDIPWVIAIRVEPAGNRNTVTTRLVRVKTRQVAVTASEPAAGVLDLVAAVGATIQTVLVRIGEPERPAGEQPELSFATSANLDALRAYAEGSAAWSRGAYHLAKDFWSRAIALDTGFAMAMGSLGVYHYFHHNRVEGERYYREALARRGRLTEWERLQIELGHANWRGDRDSALALARVTVARFPRGGTFLGLGSMLLRARRCPEGLEALERSRQFDPRNPHVYIAIATCEKVLGRHDAARLSYLAAGRLDSTMLYVNNVNGEFVSSTLLAGYPVEAESALVKMTRRPGMNDQALGFRGLGFLALWRGEVAQAREQFRRAAGLSRQQGAANSLLRNLALVVATELAAGHQAEARQTIREIDSLARGPGMAPGFLGFAADAHAEVANTGRVRELLDQVRAEADPRNREDSLLIHYLAGTLALAEGDARAALAGFDRAAGYPAQMMLALRRAQAQERLGQLDSARAGLSRIIAQPVFGVEGQIGWIGALIEIGRVEERLGRFDDAMASYRRFREHWKAADPGLPAVIAVDGRIAALSRSAKK